MKPENLLYLTPSFESPLVLADFGIAKALESPYEVLTSMAGSFGYAAPEIMLREGHGKAVDLWSLGVITYTLLCGYSPFRSESIRDLIAETTNERIIFHERYWKGVSKDAKEFILELLQADPSKRPTSKEALKHPWLKGESATDHDLLPEIKGYMARARLKRGIEKVRLANRIEALKKSQGEDEDDIPSPQELGGSSFDSEPSPPSDETTAAATTAAADHATLTAEGGGGSSKSDHRTSLPNAANGDIFREVVITKMREMKLNEEREAKLREMKNEEHEHEGVKQSSHT